MPAFSQIELYLDDSYETEENKNFIPRSRCSCNYLEKKLGELKFLTKYSRVNIYLSKKEGALKVAPLKGVPILGVTIDYDLKDVQNICDDRLQIHFIAIIERGLKAAEDFMPIPIVECLTFLNEFKENGFKNEWIQAQKEWKQKSIKSEVLASLTTLEFKLLQKIYENGNITAERIIAKTSPREIMFHDFLGSLTLDRTGVIQYKKGNQIISSFDTQKREFTKIKRTPNII
jgi:hypothetical protein